MSTLQSKPVEKPTKKETSITSTNKRKKRYLLASTGYSERDISFILSLWHRHGIDKETNDKDYLPSVIQLLIIGFLPTGFRFGMGNRNDPKMIRISDDGLSITQIDKNTKCTCAVTLPLYVGKEASGIYKVTLQLISGNIGAPYPFSAFPLFFTRARVRADRLPPFFRVQLWPFHMFTASHKSQLPQNGAQ